MGQPELKKWTIEEFFAWQDKQESRYELVNGFPLRMMAGTKNVHDDIVVNILVQLGNQLRGSGCRPFTGDGSVQISPGQIRRPDIGVDCGRRDPNGYTAAAARVIVEVLSPTTRDFDTFGKFAEYQTIPTLERVLFVDPNLAEVTVWSKDSDGAWTKHICEGLDTTIALPEIGVTLSMAEIYDDVVFPTNLRLTMMHGQKPGE